ncbi:aminoglycoside phosphotransferase (APT) family kinase protein [Paenibacillus phyllosphaerae]|uniref:Aminoglycoside phosphotransferase (APT) family kinase protein n=1 Tax=Paenibacillus phyllosphaerae TaxID=274593 RepID=A0A7W5AZC8_9BACL|nr:phosphotransferase [Paenibacillus phyllosphaerae]MBB3111249.1 aminoglycoside phosphotransferase (APT) family kinase protein [Paenibacillus phyllosphaerae]
MLNPINGSQLAALVPRLAQAVSIEPITKGYSNDRKYRVTEHDGAAYVLRVFDITEYERRSEELDWVAKVVDLGVRCSKPVASGASEALGLAYMMLTYVEGEDAEHALPLLNERQQYEVGVEAGRELARMHTIAAPGHIATWEERIVRKYENYRRAYETCGAELKGYSAVDDFIWKGIPFIRNRPNVFQHDDFHPSNLLVREGRYSGVIDFNRYDFGDPLHDLVKLGMFGRFISVPYSIGQIDGFCMDKEPDALFWQLYATYVGMVAVSSVVWILKVKPDELESMLWRLDQVIADHAGFTSAIPRWYVEGRGLFPLAQSN